jgi:hypothetical protein
MKQSQFLIQLDKAQYKTPDISKKGSVAAASRLYESIMEGTNSAVQVAEMFKFVEETSKQLKELTDDNGKNSFVELVREEIVSNSDDGKSYVTKYGNKFELMEAAGKYDMASCGDPIWNKLYSEIQSLTQRLKERESFLKGIKSKTEPMNIVDPYTGELYENVELYPPIKSSTSTYKQTMITG